MVMRATSSWQGLAASSEVIWPNEAYGPFGARDLHSGAQPPIALI